MVTLDCSSLNWAKFIYTKCLCVLHHFITHLGYITSSHIWVMGHLIVAMIDLGLGHSLLGCHQFIIASQYLSLPYVFIAFEPFGIVGEIKHISSHAFFFHIQMFMCLFGLYPSLSYMLALWKGHFMILVLWKGHFMILVIWKGHFSWHETIFIQFFYLLKSFLANKEGPWLLVLDYLCHTKFCQSWCGLSNVRFLFK